MKRTYKATVQNGLGDECEVTVRVNHRRTVKGAAILVARNRIPDEKPWQVTDIREDSSIKSDENK